MAELSRLPGSQSVGQIPQGRGQLARLPRRRPVSGEAAAAGRSCWGRRFEVATEIGTEQEIAEEE